MAISPGGRPADDSPVGTPGGQQNWVDKAGGLPKYIRMVAHALMRKGMPKQHAIAAAVNRVKRWAGGADNVRPQVQAAAAAAVAEWEAKKGMALSAHIDAAQLLDLAVPDDWQAELEGTFDPTLTLDLAREYVRDQVGKFANDNTKNRGAAQHQAAEDERKQIERNRQVNPRDLSSLKGIRGLMLDWTRIPIGERADLKPRVKAAAKRLGATPRLLALIDGLGDGDFKADKSEGAGVALRKDKANAWLKRAGFNLSADDTEGGLVLELAAAVGDELADNSLIDLAGAPGDVIDLAPGDYRPPYDWKHGFIPVTPAAALSKAKKGPHVGQGNSRRPKGARVPGKTSRGTTARPRTTAGTKSRRTSTPERPPVRATPASEASDDVLKHRAGGLGPTAREAEAELKRRQAKAADDEKRGRGVPGEAAKLEARNTPGGEKVREQRKSLKPAQKLDKHGQGQILNMPPPTSSDAAQRAAVKTNQGPGDSPLSTAQLEEMAKSNRPAIAAAAKRQLEKRKGNVAPIRRDNAGGGSHPVKPDGSPDYGAMSAEQAATIRAKEAGRGVGDRVEVEGEPGTVKAVTSRGTTVEFDGPHPTRNIPAGTPGHDRIRPLDRKGSGGSTGQQHADARAAQRDALKARRDKMWQDMSFDELRKKVVDLPPGTERDRADTEARRRGVSPKTMRQGAAERTAREGGSPKGGAGSTGTHAEQIRREAIDGRVERDRQAAADTAQRRADTARRGQERRERLANREAAGATDTGKPRRLAADRVLLDGQQYERVVGPNGGYTWRGKGNADVKDMDTRRKLDEAAPLSGSAVAVTRIENNRKTEAEGGPSATPPTRTERAMFPEGQKVAYNGRPSDGTGVVVGRRVDSQGTALEVRDDKDGKTYEWAPDQVKPHDTGSPAASARDAEVSGVQDRIEARTGKRPTADQARAALEHAERVESDKPTTSSTNPDAPIRIEHTPDGTLVHGTSREDAAAIKEVGGFKWSRNLNAWYLPRTWRPETRENKVKQLEAKLGDKAGVDKTTGPRKSAAEREADTRARAGERAERMDARAASRSAEANRRFEASDLREEKSGIPFGQPILVGHHSERRHRRAIERAHANLGKGVEAQRDAEAASAAADRARRTAAGTESKVTIGNRIAKNEREVRDLERRLAGTHSSSRRKPEGEYRQRLEGMLAEAQDQLQHDRGKMAAAGGVPSKDSVSPGDFVKIRGQWYPVRKANAKTVGVPNTYGDRTRTAPWHEVSEHRKAGDVTRADVADMVRDTSQAFPSLKTALAKAAPDTDKPTPAKIDRKLSPDAAGELSDAELTRRLGPGSSASDADKAVIRAEQQRRSGAATPGGVTPDAARRMSDDQLERTMQRLMADGNYDGPAFSVIEKELNRRDKARRAEGNQ